MPCVETKLNPVRAGCCSEPTSKGETNAWAKAVLAVSKVMDNKGVGQQQE